MKRKHLKKIIIYSTAIIIVATYIGYCLSRNNNHRYINYVNDKANSIMADDYNIVAHRGFSSLEVENTIGSLTLASKKEYVDMIEFDARLTKDGKIVLSHNNLLNVNIYRLLKISDYNYDELVNKTFIYYPMLSQYYPCDNKEDYLVISRNNNLLNNYYHLIGLKEGLKACNDKIVLLDLKFNNDYDMLINELLLELQNIDTSNIIIQSTDIKGIKYLKDKTSLKTQILISRKEDLKYIKEFNSIGLNYNLITYDLIKELIDNNKRVMLWTINRSKELDKIVNIVGDYYKDIYYITDYPDLIIIKLQEKEEKIKKKDI